MVSVWPIVRFARWPEKSRSDRNLLNRLKSEPFLLLGCSLPFLRSSSFVVFLLSPTTFELAAFVSVFPPLSLPTSLPSPLLARCLVGPASIPLSLSLHESFKFVGGVARFARGPSGTRGMPKPYRQRNIRFASTRKRVSGREKFSPVFL